jgi:hypothetical protein
VDATDDGVERLGIHGQFAAHGFLDRVAKAVASVLVAEVGRGGGESVLGGDQAVGASAGDVVLAAGTDWGNPDRPAVGGGGDLDVPAVVLVLADHHRSVPLVPGAATRSVRMTVPSRLRWV